MTEFGLPFDFDSHVDRGSWARFTPSLAAFLASSLRLEDPQVSTGATQSPTPHPVSGLVEETAGPSAHMFQALLLTAPQPLVTPASLSQPGFLGRLLGKKAPVVSPDVPGLVLTARMDGLELAIPTLDAQGRVLLGPHQRRELASLGWQEQVDLCTHLAVDAPSASATATRVLIEVLRVPHPADLDWLLQPH